MMAVTEKNASLMLLFLFVFTSLANHLAQTEAYTHTTTWAARTSTKTAGYVTLPVVTKSTTAALTNQNDPYITVGMKKNEELSRSTNGSKNNSVNLEKPTEKTFPGSNLFGDVALTSADDSNDTSQINSDNLSRNNVSYIELLNAQISKEIEKLISSGYLFLPHLYRAFIDAGKSPESYNISGTCSQQLVHYFKALNTRQGWAWNMYDSTGKQGSGLITGAMTWTGNFQQCLNTLGYVNKLDEFTSGDSLPAQFCSVYITPPTWVEKLVENFNLPFPVPFSPFIGDICVVKGCTETDLHNVVQKFINQDLWRQKLVVTKVSCYKDTILLEDVKAVVSLCIIVLLLLIVAIGTVYEIYLRSRRSGIRSSRDIPIGETSKTSQRLGYYLSTERDGIEGPRVTGFVYKNEAYNKDGTGDLRLSHSDEILDKSSGGSENTQGHDMGHSSSSPTKKSDDVVVTIEQADLTLKHVKDLAKHMGKNKKSPENDNDIIFGSTQNDPISNEIQGAYVSKSEEPERNDSTDINHSVHPHFDGNISNDPDGNPEKNGVIPQRKCSKGSNHRDFRRNSHFLSSVRRQSRARSLKKSDSFPKMQRRHLKTQLSIVGIEKSTSSAVNLFQRILVCFSFRRNITNILGRGHGDTLFCLNGVRVMSIGWIVLGTSYSTLYSKSSLVDNHVDAVKLTQSFWIQPMINTTLAADTFFVLSGTLYAYNFMKHKSKSKTKKMHKVLSVGEYIWSVIHRLARIVPCYYLVIMVYTNLGTYMKIGLQHRYSSISKNQCSEQWWANALFISNFYKSDTMCMPWTYYLVNDFQFSLLSPVVVIPLLCYPLLGYLLIVLLIATQIISVMLINTGINGNVMRMGNTGYFSQVYVKPYCRVGAYAVGLGLGHLLFTGDKKVRLRKLPLYIGWILSLTTVVVLPYITYIENQPEGKEWSGIETSLYEALSRPIWAMAVAWVIFTCCNGQGGFISKFLSWNFFIPLCRITYGVYLIHPMLIEAVVESRGSTLFVTFGYMTYSYISNFVSCWFIALLFITLVEQPFVGIEAAVRKHLHAKRA